MMAKLQMQDIFPKEIKIKMLKKFHSFPISKTLPNNHKSIFLFTQVLLNQQQNQMRTLTRKLTDEELKSELMKIPSWQLVQEEKRNVIRRKFVFKDFKQAWQFMNKVATKADEVSIVSKINCCHRGVYLS